MADDAAQRLLDLEAIKQLKARYFRLMDTKQWEAFREVFTDDVEIDVSCEAGDAGVLRGGDRFARFVERALSGVLSIHHGHMPEIELDGPDSAHGTWAMYDYLEFEDGARMHGFGHYEERYRRVDGVWRIAAMKLTRLRVDRSEPAGGEA